MEENRLNEVRSDDDLTITVDSVTDNIVIGAVEEQKTPLDGVTNAVVLALSIFLCLFEMYTAYFGVLEGLRQNAAHLGIVACIGFLSTQPFKKRTVWTELLNYVFAAMIFATMAYIFVNNRVVLYRVPMVTPVTTLQLILGIAAIVLTLILCRRTIGFALPIIACVFLTYAFLGKYFTGFLFFRGLTLDRVVEQIYLTFAGLFGEPMTISATYVFIFILFGSCLDNMGTGKFLMDISKSLVGRFRGGPGLMAVVSSALMGTISGSAVANVATTGVFTIPLMKKTGYEKNYAGAVEAVASSGGQIMPPVMGAGAFLMAEYLGCTYKEIMIAAIIPAVLYFLCVFIQVYLEARKCGLSGVPADEIKKPMEVLMDSGYMVIPLVMVIIMLVNGYSPMKSGFWGILATIVVATFKPQTRANLLKKIHKAMQSAAKSAIGVCSACACAGIVICILNQTGLGLKFSSAILSLSRGNLIVALVLAMLSSLVLGMGLPTTASYVIQATLVAPALVKLGLLPIQAHLFVFYFACVATITPPVALAAYAAAPICGGSALKVGVKAFKLGLAAFIVPYAFAFSPALLIEGEVLQVLLACVSAIVGCTALAITITGWLGDKLNFVFRVILFGGALCLIHTGNTTDVIGYGLLIAIIAIQLYLARKHNAAKA